MGHLAHAEWLTMCHVSSVESFKQRTHVGPIRDMWQHMIGEKSKVDGYGDKGNPRSQLGIDMWKNVLSKLDFRPNNTVERGERRER